MPKFTFETGYSVELETSLDLSTEVLFDEISQNLARLPARPRDLLFGQGPELDAWREGQLEVIALARALAEVCNTVYVDAPTGSGKSLIALGLAHLHRNEPRGAGATILTADIGLQEQYAEIPAVGSITGRSNWPCLLKEDKTAANAPCTTGELQLQGCEFYCQGICPYYLQKQQAVTEHPVVVTNYAWAYAGRSIQDLNHPVLIADEGHIIEALNREAYTAMVYETDIYPVQDQAQNLLKIEGKATRGKFPSVTELGEWQELFQSRFEVISKNLKEHLDKKPDVEDSVWAIWEQRRIAVEAMWGRLRFAIQLLVNEESDQRGLHWTRGKGKVTIAPLLADDYVPFHKGQYIMSGTLIKPRPEGTEYAYIQMPSSFPKESRPVVVNRVAKMGRNATELDLQAMASFIDQMLIRHNTEKGVIHCVSFSLAEELRSRSKFPQLLYTHGPGDRDAAISHFKAAPPGRALLSPSVSTGVDLPDELCRFQVIAKMPFTNLGDEILAKRQKKHPEAANLDVARAIVQAAGRGMRSADDHCVTYIADSNFGWFYRANPGLFPGWFREAVVTAK